MNQITTKTLIDAIKSRKPVINEKTQAFCKARISIVAKLLIDSYYAIGIPVPSDATIIIRATQIAENFDCGNVYLKSRFKKAIEIKGLKDLRTPITTGDLTNADRLLGEDGHTSCYKMNGRLPNLSEEELWTEEMVEYAIKYEKQDLALLMR